MTLALARDLYGACPVCPQPSWHGPAGCPLVERAPQPREQAAPCAWCRSMTWNPDRICNSARCRELEARSVARMAERRRSRVAATPPTGVGAQGATVPPTVAPVQSAGAVVDAALAGATATVPALPVPAGVLPSHCKPPAGPS